MSITSGSGGPFVAPPQPAPPQPGPPSTKSARNVPLINGTQNLVTATAPNDGQPHGFIAMCNVTTSSVETGGGIGISSYLSGGVLGAGQSLVAGGQGTGTNVSGSVQGVLDPGASVVVQQQSALTAGAATAQAQIVIF